MRKILLLQPPTLGRTHRGLYNLAALATYVESICDVRVLDPTVTSLKNCLADFDPDIVGITSYTVTYGESIEQMLIVKSLVPKALRLIGGSHISCLPESLDPVFDAGIVGDGEETLKEIIERGYRENISLIAGVCYHDGEAVKVNLRPPVDLSTLPIPRLHVYTPHVFENGCVAFITARGCPFNCIFCYSPVMQGGLRHYPVEWVADQFEYAVKTLQANFLMLLDDTVCLSIERLQAIGKSLNRRHLSGYKVAVNIRSSAVSEELCRALQVLNVVSWNCGFESGSDPILKKIKGSSASVAKHRKLVHLAHRFDVTLNGSFMFGSPGETCADMRRTLEFMEFLFSEKRESRYKGGFWTFCATPFPGTAWWELATARGLVSNHMDWSILDIKAFEHHLLLDDEVSPQQWKDIRISADQIVDMANKLQLEKYQD
jgi:anaerobic magnesium-protoporphyrin IX monomethyl ester cyclase